MSDARFAIVWTPLASPPEDPASVGWPGILYLPGEKVYDVLAWSGDAVPDLSAYAAFLVTIFGGGERHISQIRARYPQSLIIAWVDPPPEHAFCPDLWADRYKVMLAEIAQADYIAMPSTDGGEMAVYSALTGVPLVKLSLPLVTDDLRALRSVPKEDYLFTTGHSWQPHYVAAQVAACALVQHATGIPVVYTAETPQARELAEIAGLRAEFKGRVSPDEFAMLAARARIAVDLYSMHAIGRAEVVCAAVGTPCVGSATTGSGSLRWSDPWRPDMAARIAIGLLDDPVAYEEARNAGITCVESYYNVEKFHDNIRALLRKGVSKRSRAGEAWWDLAARNTPDALEDFYRHPAVLDRSYFTGRMDLYELVADAVLPHLKDGSYLIDVGCGTGELFPAIVSRTPGMHVRLLGLDRSRQALKLARLKTPEAGYRAVDFMTDDTLPWRQADVVTCLETLEHQPTPFKFMTRLASLTKASGVIIITVPNGAIDTWEGHCNFWTVNSFRDFLSEFGKVDVRLCRDGQTLLAILRWNDETERYAPEYLDDAEL